jgi:hypothetical protein
MTSTRRSIAFTFVAFIATAGRARGADEPLLVAVEVAPGLDLTPADVRQAVASELGIPVVGSREAAANTGTDVLLVWVDARELRMSLRTGVASAVSRTIVMPPDRAGRLRSISWLAGNLGRDQVGPIVARGTPPAAAHAPPATQPPRFPAAAAPHDGAGTDAVVTSGSTSGERERTDATWAITVGGGPTVQSYFGNGNWPAFVWGDGMYHVDVQHQARPESVLLGLTLEAGPSQAAPHYLGAAAFIGSGWHGRRFFLEGTVGLGVEVLGGPVKRVTVTNNSMTGTASETTTTFEPTLGLYARAQATGGVRFSQDFDVVAQVAVHLSSTGQRGCFLSSTIGVRMRLP